MAHIRKSYKLTGNTNYDFIEESYGQYPGIEWEDENNNIIRAIAFIPLTCIDRSFRVDVIVQLKPNGRDNWLYDHSFQLLADDSKYRNILNGQLVTKDEAVNKDENGVYTTIKSGFSTNAQFFIDNIGYNRYNQVVSLYEFIYKNIEDKFGL